jgi:hypothetical protein
VDDKIARVHSRPMSRIARAAVVAGALSVALFGCKKTPHEDSAYASDIRKLCNVMKLSGADVAKDPQKPLLTAQWLGANIQTKEAHQFMIKIQELDGEARAKAYEDESKKLGIDECPLASEWR